ncbi:NAD(P)/FAD-dependent oxidoreductase [Haloarchaeobius sp. HRN-SO-5]|uniref:NAD(P)/FAD-dependent oxidoreductase n=1 Tax=Haloarchaeobius sp. HRN-SO-5 TaxID=3446118 RepID=UPI003EBD06F9
MRVVVLGAGYAGVTLTKQLERSLPDDVDLVLVDDTGVHLVQHELHRVVRRPSIADAITVPLSELVDEATVREGRVTHVDREERVVHFTDDGRLSYDVAAVCLGAETAYYDLPGVEEHSTPLKRLEDAYRIRDEFDRVLESGGRVVVGGAGLSGVQVAGELAELAEPKGGRCSPDDAGTAGGRDQTDEPQRIDIDATDDPSSPGNAGPTDDADDLAETEPPETVDDDWGTASEVELRNDVTVTLLEQFDSVAPTFPERFQRAVHDQLTSRGVEVRTGATVTRATDDEIHLEDGSVLDYDQLVWTGGIRGPDALDGERPVVRSHLRLDRTTFVVGDAARMVDDDGEAVPASSQAAIRAAKVGAANVERLVSHLREGDVDDFEPRLKRFDFNSPGWLVSVGNGAVAQVGPTVFTGRAALALKASVGAGYLSSVGAVREAVDLVNEELGIDPGRDD